MTALETRLERIEQQQAEILALLKRPAQPATVNLASDELPATLTVENLAKRWGTTPGTICRYERTRWNGLRAFRQRPKLFTSTMIRQVEEASGRSRK